MPLLLVDDRDGRIVAEIQTEAEARRLLDAWTGHGEALPDYLVLIEVRSHHGAWVGTDTSVCVRPMSWP